MGQRLVVVINSGGKDLANAYYHWSGYSWASLETIMPIIEFLKNNKLKNITTLKAIKLLQLTRAELLDSELEYCIKNNIPIKRVWPNINRNNGLIAVSPAEMGQNLYWSEGTIRIFVDEQKINYGVCWAVDEDEIYLRSEEEKMEPVIVNLELDDFPLVDFMNVPFLMDKIEEVQSLGGYLESGNILYGVIY
jgi:hypothetical protein